MITQVLYAFLLLTGLGGIICLVEYLHSRMFIQHDYTRKIAHVLASFASLIFLIKAISPFVVLFIALFFSVLLWLGKRKNYFEAIDSMKGRSNGSFILPVSILLIFLISRVFQNPLLFILPLLILAISDPLAWLTGTYFRNRTKRIILFNRILKKTIIGTVVFFLSSFLISLIVLAFFGYNPPLLLFLPLVIAGTDTLIELLTPYGMDNLTVPLATVFVLLIIH